jgi:hypothetical protein
MYIKLNADKTNCTIFLKFNYTCTFHHLIQRVSIALQCAQAIAILQHAITFGWGFSSFLHIIAIAPLSLFDLWQTIAFSS